LNRRNLIDLREHYLHYRFQLLNNPQLFSWVRGNWI
jgi:hypothetical protein